MRYSQAILSRRSVLAAATFGFAAVLAAGKARAHHGWGSYDAANVLTLVGPIRALSYANPHCMIEVEADGKAWECVLAPPFRMQNRGIPDGLMKVGMVVTVVGYASTAHPGEMRAERITIDGKTVELR